MEEKVICNNCQQPFNLCECDFDIIEQQLRDMRNEAIKNGPPPKADKRSDKEYSVNYNRNQNRYRNF